MSDEEFSSPAPVAAKPAKVTKPRAAAASKALATAAAAPGKLLQSTAHMQSCKTVLCTSALLGMHAQDGDLRLQNLAWLQHLSAAK